MSLECPPHARRERKSETWVSKMLLVRLKSSAVKKIHSKGKECPREQDQWGPELSLHLEGWVLLCEDLQ